MAGEKLISLVLFTLGVVKSIQPHWLYFDHFIISQYPNITDNEVRNDIIPARDYSCLILTLFVIIVTDYVKYKPIVILQGVFSVILMSLLIWDQLVIPLIIAQVLHGFLLATDIAFYAYIFSIVNTEKYKLNLCLTQFSVLFGQFLGNLLAVLFISLKITSNFDVINYISFAFSLLSLLLAMILPHVKPRIPSQREIIERELCTPSGLTNSDTLQKSPWEVDRRTSVQSGDDQVVIDSYAHVNDPAFTAYARSNMFSDIDTSSIGFYGEYSTSERFNSSIGSESIGESSITSRGENPIVHEAVISIPAKTQSEKMNKFLNNIKKAYSEQVVVYWSLWLIASGCGFFILTDKFSKLLHELVPTRNDPMAFDGGTETLAGLLGMIPVLLYGIIKRTCSIYSEPMLVVMSLFSCVLITVLPNTSNIWLIYTIYIIIYIIFQFGFVLALYLIGDILQSRRYGFIFGVNLFLAVTIKLILSAILDNKHALNLDVSVQITVVGGLFGLFGLGFLIKIFFNIFKMYTQNGECCGSYSNPQDRDLLVTST